jgi:hypothetical protein
MHREDVLSVESELGALRADGYSRARASEIVIQRTLAAAHDSPAVVLVEGLSDRIALEVVAARRGRNLQEEGVCVVPMGGATNIRRFLTLFGPRGSDARLAGLYDSAQEGHVGRSLEQAGFGRDLDRAGMESLGFYACIADLEDELIHCLGPVRVERIIEEQGELASFRRMQNEPFHRERTLEQHIHRFIGAHSGRKYRYARLLAQALDIAFVPRPLQGLLAHVT